MSLDLAHQAMGPRGPRPGTEAAVEAVHKLIEDRQRLLETRRIMRSWSVHNHQHLTLEFTDEKRAFCVPGRIFMRWLTAVDDEIKHIENRLWMEFGVEAKKDTNT